ncbi:hypothetical protein D3C79_983950 [compost metagenome]
MTIRHYLNFDVLRVFNVFLKENRVITKSIFSFTFSLTKTFFQFFIIPDNSHASSSAPSSGFQH